MKTKLNGLAKWIIIGLAVATIAYNTIVVQVTMKNEIKHVIIDVAEIKRLLYQHITK